MGSSPTKPLYNMKFSFSSVDLAAIVAELQYASGGKIQQIYQSSKRHIVFQLYTKRGKEYLHIIPGKMLYMTSAKDKMPAPTSLCMLLRKKIGLARIQSIRQHEAERVIVIELTKPEPYTIVIELFNRGSFVLLENKKIIASLGRQITKDRAIQVNEVYEFPPPMFNWRTCTREMFDTAVLASDRKNVITTMATVVGLGGRYATECVRRSGMDMQSVLVKDTQPLWDALESIRADVEKAERYIEDTVPCAVALEDTKKTDERLVDMLERFVPKDEVNPYEQKRQQVEKILTEQENQERALLQQIEDNQRKGELIYEYYGVVQKIIDETKVLSHEKLLELRRKGYVTKVSPKDKFVEIETDTYFL